MKLKKIAASVVAAAMAVSLTACGVNVTGVDVPENIELAVGETTKLDVSFLGDEGAAQDKLDEAGGKSGKHRTIQRKGRNLNRKLRRKIRGNIRQENWYPQLTKGRGYCKRKRRRNHRCLQGRCYHPR